MPGGSAFGLLSFRGIESRDAFRPVNSPAAFGVVNDQVENFGRGFIVGDLHDVSPLSAVGGVVGVGSIGGTYTTAIGNQDVAGFG